MSTLTFDNGGRLALPAPVVRSLGNGPLTLVSHSPGHLLLASSSGAAGVVLAGNIGSLAVVDLLSFFNLFRKTGRLCFTFAGGAKELVFIQGEVVFATSTFPQEDLGETLFALGKVDRDALLRARHAANGSGAVGKVLVDAGSVAAKDLWLAARVQVETIIYNLFTEEAGSFVFHDDTPDPDQPRFTLSTQNLIMEGLRRIDERTLFLRHIPSLDAIPVTCGKAADELPPAEQRLLAHIASGKLQVRGLLRKAGLGEFDGLRMLHHLAEQGFITVPAAPTAAATGAIGELLGVFNGALASLHRQISPVCPGFAQEVRLFLRDLPHPFSVVFGDCALHDDGTLDGGRIAANLAGLGEADKKRLLADAFNELLYMECIVARRELGGTASSELVHRVQEIGRRVKGLIGRET